MPYYRGDHANVYYYVHSPRFASPRPPSLLLASSRGALFPLRDQCGTHTHTRTPVVGVLGGKRSLPSLSGRRRSVHLDCTRAPEKGSPDMRERGRGPLFPSSTHTHTHTHTLLICVSAPRRRRSPTTALSPSALGMGRRA